MFVHEEEFMENEAVSKNFIEQDTRAPVDAHQKQASDVVSPRLACVKPVASVHPEPGSNSPL